MARIITPFEQFFDGSGNPLVSGFLYFFESGSSTMFKSTFADVEQTIPNSNPVVLNGDGRCPNVFGSGAYRVILATADDVQILTRDPVGGDEGIAFGANWNEGVIYSVDNVVFEDGSYWISLTNNNLGNQPSTDGGVNWSAINFGGSAPSNATVFNHIGGNGTDVLRTGGDTVFPLIRRQAATGATFGFDGLSVFYSGDAITEIEAQVTYPFTDNRVFVASETDVRIITNLDAGWASRVEYVFSESGAATFGGVAVVRQGDNVTLGSGSTARDFELNNRRAAWTPIRFSGASVSLDNTLINHIYEFTSPGTGTIVSDQGYDGAMITITNTTASNCTIAISGGTLNWLQGGSNATGSRTLAPFSACTVLRASSTIWRIFGNGLS